METSAAEKRAVLDAVLAKMDKDAWKKLRKQLLTFAVYRSRSSELGEDLVQRAMEKLLDPRRSSWDPAKQPVLARHLMSVVNSELQNERTSARARRDVPLDKDPEDKDDLRDERAFSEDRAVEMDLHARRLGMLRKRLERNAFALELLALTLDGRETPAALATATGRTIDEVIVTRRLMLRHAADVAHELGGDDARDEGQDDEDDAEAEEVA